MEPPIPDLEPSGWSFPSWLERHLLPDSRFARAYNALGDARRALLKSLITRHYALTPPVGPLQSSTTCRFGLFERTSVREPAPFALLFLDASIDSPALMLAALVPALCARVPEVLVVRLGGRADVSDTLLASCELVGQERLAALGPLNFQRLLMDCAVSGLPGIILYPDTADSRHVLGRPAVRQALEASPLRLAPLRTPCAAGLWRDSSLDFPPEDVALLYGDLPFETLGAVPGQRSRKAQNEAAWQSFRSVQRDLLLVPAARAGQGRAAITVSGACLGLWRWPGLHQDIFVQERHVFIST
jgi:hypothetical protein